MHTQMKEQIADAFLTLADQRHIDKITVKDLAAYCGISRASFYYHFQDILELIEWIIQRTQDNISAQCREAATFEDAVHILVHSFSAQYRLYEKLRNSQKGELLGHLVMNSLRDHFHSTAQMAAQKSRLILSPSDTQAVLNFYSFGLAGLMVQNYKSKTPNPDDFTAKVYSRIKVTIYEHSRSNWQ